MNCVQGGATNVGVSTSAYTCGYHFENNNDDDNDDDNNNNNINNNNNHHHHPQNQNMFTTVGYCEKSDLSITQQGAPV